MKKNTRISDLGQPAYTRTAKRRTAVYGAGEEKLNKDMSYLGEAMLLEFTNVIEAVNETVSEYAKNPPWFSHTLDSIRRDWALALCQEASRGPGPVLTERSITLRLGEDCIYRLDSMWPVS